MTLATPPAPPHEQGVLLRHLSWNLYEQLLDEVAGQHVFVTYDRGSVEIMSPSWKHERYAELSGALVRILATELKIPLIGGGSTTFRKKKAEAGLEPDKCFMSSTPRPSRGNVKSIWQRIYPRTWSLKLK